MKQLFLLTLFLAFVENSIAQADYERRTLNAKKTLDSIMVSEKNILKEKLKEIDKLLDIKQITKEIASEKKSEAVLAFEQKIKEERKKIVDNFWENSAEKPSQENENISQKIDSILKRDTLPHAEKTTSPQKNWVEITKKRSSYPKKVHLARGRTGFTFALGFHNMSSAEHISNDKFRVWGSKSVEIGFFRDVRVLKNHNLLHFNYGLSWMMDKLKMKSNEHFVNTNGVTEIRPYAVPVIKSKFKSHYLIFPISLEFDLTPSYTHSDKEYFPSHRSFRFGVGGYVGLLLNNKQKVKYRLSGTNYKDVSYSDYNVNEWTYGVSAYFGVGNGVFYARYSLVPLFRNNPVKEYPFSIGIRWDWL